MNQNKKSHKNFFYNIELSALLTIIGIIFLFSTSILVIMFLPMFIEESWVTPTSPYMKQMYEVEDPSIFIGSTEAKGFGGNLQQVQVLRNNFTLLAFKDTQQQRIISSPDLEKFITKQSDTILKLTSRTLLLRIPEGEIKEKAKQLLTQLIEEWEKSNPKWKEEGIPKAYFEVLELYDPNKEEAFAYSPNQSILQNWIDENFVILDETVKQPYHQDYGVVYVQNPLEYRISPVHVGGKDYWNYNPEGKALKNIEELKSLGNFISRKELISLGEHIYAIEGCWYCHTIQTRTLIQDTVLNGSDSYPAPPSSPNEYVYQKITFPGTRRIGPDLSRVGVKRPSRDWHKGHFWAPKTASAGSIMPAFQHFFDNDPRGTNNRMGIPNYRFEAIYQYMMTYGTRITPPNQAWWIGKDPIRTLEIIEGKRSLK